MRKKSILALTLLLTFISMEVASTRAVIVKGVTLYAGQNTPVGTVVVEVVGGNLIVTYNVWVAGWILDETHLYVGTSAPTKSAPGQFPYKSETVYNIPLADLGAGPGDTLYIAVHAVVLTIVDWDGCTPIYQDETAWGWGCDGGTSFGRSWARYFTITIPN